MNGRNNEGERIYSTNVEKCEHSHFITFTMAYPTIPKKIVPAAYTMSKAMNQSIGALLGNDNEKS
jgi:hypothetical protein